jgi:hypothetical protein
VQRTQDQGTAAACAVPGDADPQGLDPEQGQPLDAASRFLGERDDRAVGPRWSAIHNRRRCVMSLPSNGAEQLIGKTCLYLLGAGAALVLLIGVGIGALIG